MRVFDAKIFDDRLKEPGMLPCYAKPGDAGMDLRACIHEPLTLQPGDTVLVPSGLGVHLKDPSLAIYLMPRSGMGHKNKIVLGNLVAVVDSQYTGQIMLSLWNRGSEPFTIQPMDRVAQMVVGPVLQIGFNFVDDFEETPRGASGFGSSGAQ